MKGPQERAGAAGVVILAAGASSRMGQAKALLRVAPPGDQTFLQRIFLLAHTAGVRSIVVTIGPPHGEAIRAAVQAAPLGASPCAAPVNWAINDDPGRGMLSSVQVGLRHLPAGTRGALIWPVDLPYLQQETLDQILAHAHTDLLIPTFAKRCGHPLWVPRRLFGDLLRLPVAAGLRQLRLDEEQRQGQGQGQSLLLPVADPFVLRDIDTPEELQRAQHDQQNAR